MSKLTTGKPTICIYHGNCADGFGAAWAVWKRFPDWEFYPGVYQTEPPDVTDRDVVMVDFSYKRPVLVEMAAKSRSVVILDHHKTASEDLAGFQEPRPDIRDCWNEAQALEEPYVRALFDMGRSGAGIAWDYFHGGERPALINHIEDRDLWRFDLQGTREIQAALFSYPYDFEIWDQLITDFEHGQADLINQGTAIERKHHKDVAELVGVTKRRMKIGGYDVPVASLPYTLASDAGHLMAKDAPFAACYWDTPEGRTFSLRSVNDGLDVSEIAKEYGGGGHKHAAGFAVPRHHELAKK